MAIQNTCDGCGQPVETPNKIGIVLVRDYCDACKAVVEAYMQARDDLHTALASEWDTGATALREEYGAKLEALPDA
jgi:hypothetical protein